MYTASANVRAAHRRQRVGRRRRTLRACTTCTALQ
jgi:hypothetical protein